MSLVKFCSLLRIDAGGGHPRQKVDLGFCSLYDRPCNNFNNAHLSVSAFLVAIENPSATPGSPTTTPKQTAAVCQQMTERANCEVSTFTSLAGLYHIINHIILVLI